MADKRPKVGRLILILAPATAFCPQKIRFFAFCPSQSVGMIARRPHFGRTLAACRPRSGHESTITADSSLPATAKKPQKDRFLSETFQITSVYPSIQ